MLAGLFVGGGATRMGGYAKGLLPTREGETVIARTARLFEAHGCEVVLVGENPLYAHLPWRALPDTGFVQGPIAGVLTLLRSNASRVFAVACDMPFISASLVEKLVIASADHIAVAPQIDGHWEPLFSAYQPPRIADFDTEAITSPSQLLTALEASPLLLTDDDRRALVDWDTPEDIARSYST